MTRQGMDITQVLISCAFYRVSGCSLQIEYWEAVCSEKCVVGAGWHIGAIFTKIGTRCELKKIS